MSTNNIIAAELYEQDVGNKSGGTIPCGSRVPYSWEILKDEDNIALTLLCLCWGMFLVIILLYVDNVIFFRKHFGRNERCRASLYVLALTPVFAFCAVIGVMVPRAGALVDLVSNSYLAISCHQMLLLIYNYLGNVAGMQALDVPVLRFNTGPCCCCCPCLPKVNRSHNTFLCMFWLVQQTMFIRPLLMFLAAVLWADGSYIPGKISLNDAFIYINIPNIISSLLAVWGLMLVQTNYAPYLKKFGIRKKFGMIQMILLGSSVGNLVIGILVSKGVIPCTRYMPSTSRAQTVFHTYSVFLMLVTSIFGRFAFRRKSDAAPEGVQIPRQTDMEQGSDEIQPLEDNNGNETLAYEDTGSASTMAHSTNTSIAPINA